MIHARYLIGTVAILLTTLWGCGNDSDYVIESNPNEFAVFPVAIPVDADGGTYELTVTGNESWTAELTNSNSPAQGWCTLSETSGTGKKVITLTVTPSTSFVKNRSVIIEVSSGSKILKSKVLQETMVLGEDEVLINGMIWSTKNVGTPGSFVASPDDIGQLYQFNRKVGYPAGPQDDPAPANWPAEYTNDGTNWTAENDPSPEGWRVPTTEEMAALWEKGATWVTAAQTGFKTDGIIIGVDEATAKRATKDNRNNGPHVALRRAQCQFAESHAWRHVIGRFRWLPRHMGLGRRTKTTCSHDTTS